MLSKLKNILFPNREILSVLPNDIIDSFYRFIVLYGLVMVFFLVYLIFFFSASSVILFLFGILFLVYMYIYKIRPFFTGKVLLIEGVEIQEVTPKRRTDNTKRRYVIIKTKDGKNCKVTVSMNFPYNENAKVNLYVHKDSIIIENDNTCRIPEYIALNEISSDYIKNNN